MTRKILTLALAVLPACGGGSSPAATATPAAAARSNIVIAQAFTGQVCRSPVRTARIQVPVRILELSGISANYNFVRLSLMLGGREVEGSEMTATDLQRMNAGRLTGNSFLNVTFTHDVNASSGQWDSFAYLSSFTDDRGNAIEIPLPGPFSVVNTATCSS